MRNVSKLCRPSAPRSENAKRRAALARPVWIPFRSGLAILEELSAIVTDTIEPFEQSATVWATIRATDQLEQLLGATQSPCVSAAAPVGEPVDGGPGISD
jgi:hypothetical protein